LPLDRVAKIKRANITHAKKKLCENFTIYGMWVNVHSTDVGPRTQNALNLTC